MTIPYCEHGYWVSPEGVVHGIDGFEEHNLKAQELGFSNIFRCWDAGWASITVSLTGYHAGVHVSYALSIVQVAAILRAMRQHEFEHIQLRRESCNTLMDLARLLRKEVNAPKEVHGNLVAPGRSKS